MKEILFKNDFSFNFIFNTINEHKEKELLGTFINDQDKNLVKLTFLIDKSKKEAYQEALMNFEWSDKTLKIIDLQRKNSNFHLDTKVKRKVVNFYQKIGMNQIFFTIFKIYKIENSS